jgi:6-pyruvoyltetrahydropterin/6-carboxytetrahydropterin synthase
MYELITEAEFAAAHRLREYDGQCENLHGHNWKVELVVAGEELGPLGMLIDFRDIKAILNDVLDTFDHKYLNELPPFTECNPTTENLSRVIYEMVNGHLPKGVCVRSVTTWESSRCGARYSES